MIKLMTRDEFLAKAAAPMSFMKVENSSWGAVHRDMIVKWLEAHTGAGWVYWDGASTYIFQNSGDHLLFKMWVKSDPFEKEEGEIT